MRYRRSIKSIAITVLVAFIFTFVFPAQSLPIIPTQNVKQARAAIKYDTPKASTSLGNFADKLLAYAESMKKSVEKRDLKTLRDQVKKTSEAMKSIRNNIYSELSENKKTLEKLDAKTAAERQEKFKAELDSKLNSFDNMVAKLDKESAELKDLNSNNTAVIEADIEKIEKKINPDKPQQTLGTLPHNNADITPPKPADSGGITPAYSGSSAAAQAEQVLSRTPVDADLAETPETKLAQEVKAKADSLNTALKIYEYVKNSIDFEPYYGSRKGATGTLNQLAGNDYDQASLLIAMLRYKGIPSRYVTGTVEVPIEKVEGWTGAKTPEAAAAVLGSLGIPTVSVISGGTIVAARFEHTWTEAYVPYENYRGAGDMQGSKAWVPLDPSFKQYKIEAGIDVKSITGTTDQQLLDALQINGDKSSDGDAITNINTTKINSLANSVTDKIQQYIKDNNLENADAKKITGGKKIIPENLGLLPLTLPYKTIAVLSETDKVQDSIIEKVGFSIKGNDPFNLDFSGTDDFNVQFSAVELYGKRITLSWVPATQEDADIINNYGGLFKTPAYMIQLKPQVKADGQVIAEGKAVGFGNRQQFTIAMGHAGRPVENVVNAVTAGGYYSISLDYGKIDTEELSTIRDRISAVKDTATEADIYIDNVMGEILNSVGKAYFGQLDAYDSVLSGISKVSSVRQVSEAMTGYMPTVKYMFNAPVEVTGGSFFIDVDHDVFGVSSLEGDKKSETGYMMNSGILGSAMESKIEEQVFQLPSVSTIKLLAEASSRHIPIYTIGKYNIDKLSEIEASSSVKTDITNAVNSGKIVVIPQHEIRYYNWQGSGYIVMDPDTGAAGYMISGGIAGGSAAFDVVVSLAGLALLVWAIYDTVTAAMAVLAAASPIIAGIFYVLYVLNIINVLMTLNTIISFWETGDYKYASDLMTNLIMNIIFFGVFKLLDKFGPNLLDMFQNIRNRMAGLADVEERFGKDAADLAARYGPDGIKAVLTYGDDAVNAIRDYGDDAVQLIKTYGDDALRAMKNYGGDAVRAIKNYGPDALKAINQFGPEAVEVITKYGDDAVRAITKYGEDGLTAIYYYGDRLAENIAKYGDDAVECAINYGDNAINAMKNGIEPSLMKELDNLGIKPSDFDRLGIVSKEIAERTAEAVEAALAKGSTKTWGEFLTANSGKSIEEASSSYINLIDGESPWPEGFDIAAHTTKLKAGDTFNVVLDKNQDPKLLTGRFGTFDNIPNVDYARNEMAIKSNWKLDCGQVATYRVKAGVELEVIEGPVGPQIDLNADKYLPGGASQINFTLDRSVNIMDYLELIPDSVHSIY